MGVAAKDIIPLHRLGETTDQGFQIDKVLAAVPDPLYLEGLQQDHIWEPVGCNECNNSGYQGRIGLYEAIVMNKEIEEAVLSNPSERDIETASRSQHLLNLTEDGVMKVLTGLTSLSELGRVVDLSGLE